MTHFLLTQLFYGGVAALPVRYSTQKLSRFSLRPVRR
jgi:hypothetical protein